MQALEKINLANGKQVWEIKRDFSNNFYAQHKYLNKTSPVFESRAQVEKFISEN
jgi:hypothetical protein